MNLIGDRKLTIVNLQLIFSRLVTAPPAPSSAENRSSRDAEVGLAYGIAAYAWWGLIPVYFKLVAHLPPLAVLAHRIVWSFVFLAALVALRRRQWGELRELLRSGRTLGILAASTVLLATNWGTFIYAVSENLVLQASLGYFIVPLVSVVLAVTVLKERLRAWQSFGVALAAVGVAVLTLVRGGLPVIALSIAFSWSGYALLRKIAHAGPLIGLAVETAMLTPLAAAYALWPRAAATIPAFDYALLMLAGVVTALPLLWFTAAAKRLRLSTVGFLQYLAPTGQFLLAIFAYGEPFGGGNLIGFAFIWAALAVYSVDSLRAYRARATLGDPEDAQAAAVAEL